MPETLDPALSAPADSARCLTCPRLLCHGDGNALLVLLIPLLTRLLPRYRRPQIRRRRGPE